MLINVIMVLTCLVRPIFIFTNDFHVCFITSIMMLTCRVRSDFSNQSRDMRSRTFFPGVGVLWVIKKT